MFLAHNNLVLVVCPVIVDRLLITNKLLIVSNLEDFLVN